MFSGVLLLGVLVGAALLGHQRSGKRARARKLARLNGVKVLMMSHSVLSQATVLKFLFCQNQVF